MCHLNSYIFLPEAMVIKQTLFDFPVSYVCVNISITEGATPLQDCRTAWAGPGFASVSGFLSSLLSSILAEQNQQVGCGDGGKCGVSLPQRHRCAHVSTHCVNVTGSDLDFTKKQNQEPHTNLFYSSGAPPMYWTLSIKLRVWAVWKY